MSVEERFFLFGDEWNVIHLPGKPNGFCIFIIGDVNHYVKENTSSWHQRPDQTQFIEALKEAGYTIVYSNLYGRHWGSEEACCFFQRLYNEVMKQEILNKKAHVIAEGMGALVVAKLLPNLVTSVRSVVMINPCLNLNHYFHTIKNNKLFYKRFLKELKSAYQLDEVNLKRVISYMQPSNYEAVPIPIKILHCLGRSSYSLEDHSRLFEQKFQEEKKPIDLSILLDCKSFERLANPTIQFLKTHEKKL